MKSGYVLQREIRDSVLRSSPHLEMRKWVKRSGLCGTYSGSIGVTFAERLLEGRCTWDKRCAVKCDGAGVRSYMREGVVGTYLGRDGNRMALGCDPCRLPAPVDCAVQNSSVDAVEAWRRR